LNFLGLPENCLDRTHGQAQAAGPAALHIQNHIPIFIKLPGLISACLYAETASAAAPFFKPHLKVSIVWLGKKSVDLSADFL